MTDLLSRLNSAIDGLCPCGAPPRDGTAYCGDDCQPTHIGTDTGGSAMRWRPDLVTAEEYDPDLIPVESTGGYAGPFTSHVFQRAGSGTWHLRLDDGCRFVGADLNPQDLALPALLDAMSSVWRRLEQELGNPRRSEPAPDPWRDVERRWAAQERDRQRAAAQEPICAWLRANNIDPNDVPRHSPIDVTVDGIALLTAVRDGGRWQFSSDGDLVTEERSFPLIEPWTHSRPLAECLDVLQSRNERVAGLRTPPVPGRPAPPLDAATREAPQQAVTEFAAVARPFTEGLAHAFQAVTSTASEAPLQHPMLQAIERRH